MNNSFLAVIKRIVAEQGEGILGDPRRIKPFIKDYAQQVPQEERRAFGRCLEQGFYRQLKAANTTGERLRLKDALARQLQAATGISAALCSGALDLLDAAVPLSHAASAPFSAAQTGAAILGALPGIPRITKRTLIFGAAAGAGALAGELVSEMFRINENIGRDFWGLVLNVGFWAALIGLGITVALNIAQSKHLKRTPPRGVLIKTALIGIAIGIAGGAIAQMIFGYTSTVSTPVEIVSRVICWGILGWGLGFGASFYVPNYPVKRAMLAGLAGGIAGGVIFRALLEGLPVLLVRVFGVTIYRSCNRTRNLLGGRSPAQSRCLFAFPARFENRARSLVFYLRFFPLVGFYVSDCLSLAGTGVSR
ncbi:MAG: hypothetical protein LBC88_02945 [Spirochaetaceae bacterium]|nr:hypothetical protein [Spirochaetaceae bacterium]